MALIFSYGDYVFDPKPLFNISKEYIKTSSQGMGLGTRYTLTIDGEILPSGGRFGDDPGAGINTVFSGLDGLSRAFDTDFKLLHLYCDDSSVPIISGYPRIVGFDIDHASDNYVVRGDYSITLELPSLTGAGFDPVGSFPSGAGGCGIDDVDLSEWGIVSYSDDFTVEFLDERIGGPDLSLGLGSVPSIFSIQRNITAQGDAQVSDTNGTCNYPYLPWQRATGFVMPKLGIPPELTQLGGLLCPSGKAGAPDTRIANNFRTVNINKTDGSVSVNETFIALTGSADAYEDFEINTSQSLEDPYVTITIDGTINGLTNIGYGAAGECATTGMPKFNNAIAHWSGISGSVLARAQQVYAVTALQSGHIGAPGSFPLTSEVNPLELSKTVGYNPIAGTVTYSFTYNNRPTHCYKHALVEDITFSESEPNDVFASLTILGKKAGPLYQSIGTVGQRTRELSINAILPPSTTCCIVSGLICPDGGGFFSAPDAYDALVVSYAAVLDAHYDQVFVTSSSKTWEPKTGRFSLNQSWTVGKC